MQSKKLWRIVGWAGLLGLLLALPVLAAPAESHRAGVVIDYGDGRVNTYCVIFTEPTLTGYELLQRTGVEITSVFEANGVAVCRLGGSAGAGCAASNCFCQSPLKYWSYWNQQGGTWVYSNVGASSAQVSAGTVNGWLWSNATQPPAAASFDAICAPAEPTPTHMPTATATPTMPPTPSPTATAPASQSQAVPATATPEPSAKFWADAETLEAGTCALLHWETVEMIAVWLDGESADLQGTVTICPCEPETHELEVTYPDGSTELLTVKVAVEGECVGSGMMVDPTLTPTILPSGAAIPTASTTRTPAEDRGAPPAEPLPTPLAGTPDERRGDLPRSTPSAPSEGTPGRFLSILPTPTPPALPPTATPPAAGGLAGDTPPFTTETAWTPASTPEAKATLPAGTAAALLATPTRHLMDAPDAETGASAYIPERVAGAPEAAAETAAERVLQNWSGYLTFGLLLVALGGAHLFIQRRNG